MDNCSNGLPSLSCACALCLAVLSRHITLKNFRSRDVALFSHFSLFAFGISLSITVIMVMITESLVNFVVHVFIIYIIMALSLVLVLIPYLPLGKEEGTSLC